MTMLTTEFAELTSKQVKCLPFLAIGCTAAEVAEKVKVSQVQISEWKRNPQFMSALDTVRRNALSDAGTALTALANDAVQTLRELLINASSEQVKLRAAMYIIDKLCISQNMELKRLEPNGQVNMSLLLTALGTSQEIL